MKLNTKNFKISSIIFLLFFIIGFIAIYVYCQTIEFDKSKTNELIKNQVTFSGILINNLIVCGIAILGVITFRVSSVLVLIVNALVLGVIIGVSYATTGQLWYFIQMLIPHSIFEIPAILLSCSIGFEGFSYFTKYNLKEKIFSILLIVILLVIAAFVEVNISTLFT